MKEEVVKIQAYIAKDTKKEILEIAELQNRSESNMVNILILEALIYRDTQNQFYQAIQFIRDVLDSHTRNVPNMDIPETIYRAKHILELFPNAPEKSQYAAVLRSARSE